MMIIANPIYDSVFKFMLEDERVARILLSALLKKDVRELQMRRNEYSNIQQTRISLFRIDFSAKITDESGEEQLVLIELQKTWLATETLRFRQYLGSQYLDKENVPSNKDNPKGYGLPIISIYILGHKLGDLKQPVVYVRRRYLDYDNIELTEGVPDPFIESLTHDSIIVQIPYLQGRARNRLERLLKVFDQDYRIAENDHLLSIDEGLMEADERLVLSRLAMAFASPDIRKSMSVEDEILSEIEARDTTIMLKAREIESKDKEIESKDKELESRNEEIKSRDKALEQKDQMLKSAIHALVVKKMTISEISIILSVSEEDVLRLMN